MTQLVHAPNSYPPDRFTVFLAGSIEMGKAEDWQSRLARELDSHDIVLLNPRRPDWDDSWEQRASHPQFNEQVTWELIGLERADLIVFYFAPGTMSPISLLELGLYLGQAITGLRLTDFVVCCPEGFWRKGNVDITCARYGVPLTETWDDFMTAIKARLPRVTV